MRNLHIDHDAFKRTTLTLHMCDMITEEQENYRKIPFTLKNTHNIINCCRKSVAKVPHKCRISAAFLVPNRTLAGDF